MTPGKAQLAPVLTQNISHLQQLQRQQKLVKKIQQLGLYKTKFLLSVSRETLDINLSGNQRSNCLLRFFFFTIPITAKT